MPPKRKLRQGENELLEDQALVKRGKTEQSEDDEELKDINNEATYREVLEHLYKQRDVEDRPLWKMFDVLPSEEEFPVYYEFIKDPIDLKTIKKKIQTHQYNTIDELEMDILLVFKNAHAFNEPKSQISKDATQLKKAYLAKRIELNKSLLAAKVGRRLKERLESRGSGTGDSEHSENDDFRADLKADDRSNDEWPSERLPDPESMLRHVSSPMMDRKDDGLIDETFDHNCFSILYNMVVGYRDQTGRQLALPFLRLPIKRTNPAYFEVVKKPMSLQKIRTKIKSSYYSDINILAKDMSTVFENGQLFHEEQTPLHVDAVLLQRLTYEKKSELEKTSQYIEMREHMPKRGRPRVPKGKEGKEANLNDDGSPVVKRKVKQVSTPDTIDPKVQKERMLLMYNTVLEYKDSDGRSLSTMFLELPDPEEYPEYYKVIPHPIDMERIHEKIINNVYSSEVDFIHDFEILFQNARHFNEEGSEIYEDSVILEKALKKKRRYLNHIADGKDQSPGKGRQSSPSCINRSQELLHHIRSYADDTGRVLSAIFERLPSRVEYPDYYILIKRPIDLTYIAGRAPKYASIDDLEQDLLLLFNNACIYNEPDSQIYKDALTLLRIMTQKKNELCPEVESDLPDVQVLVQDLMTKLFNNTVDHRDEEGRCYSDSLLEVTVDDCSTPTGEPDEKRRKQISLPIIGQLLKLGFYKRLDVLQNDVFSILKEARRNATIDSEMFEDACELHTFFILERDVLTKEGVRMISPALNTTGKLVQQEIDYERKEKMQVAGINKVESDEDSRTKGRFKEAVTFEVTPEEDELIYNSSATQGGVTYQVGDYAYVKPEDPTRPANVISVDKIWQQKDGLQGIYGCWYYRPEATYHLASRKFMERELFRSCQNSFIMMHGVIGKCYVMNVREHIKFKPQKFDEADVFVCESRYTEKSKGFKKIKNHPPTASHITMVARDTPLQVKRVASIFAVPSQSDGKKDNQLEHQESEDLTTTTLGCEMPSTVGYEVPLEKSVEVDIPIPEVGCTYYEKYLMGDELWKLGDCVYVKVEDEGYVLLSKIDKLWTDSSGKAYFRGNWYILPEDTKHLPTQFFMEKECFESNIEENIPVSSIAGRCAILNQKDYQSTRPTEIPEKDVYVCTAHYNEDELKFRKNMKGFKKLSVSEHIRDDEYWISDRAYPSKRRPSLWLTSTEMNGAASNEKEKDEDLDNVGFTLMKKEYAAFLMKENPEIPLDEISTKTEEKWSTLTDEEKEEFRMRGKKQGLGEEYMIIFQCCWGTCQYQFEDLQDLMIHVMEGPHLSILSCEGTTVYNCEWRECERLEKHLKPFPTHSRLVRHIREIHFKNAGKKILASQKSKFYFPRHQTCEEMFKQGSDNSDRPSSRDSSTASSLSPSGPHRMNKQQPMSPGMMPNAPGSHLFPNAIHLQAGMFPPYRLNGQATPQAVMQQQIMQQQQMMMQARGQMMNNPMSNASQMQQMMNNPPPQMMNNAPPQMMNNQPPPQMMNNNPSQMMNNAPPQVMNNQPPQMMNNQPPQMMNNQSAQMMNNQPPQMSNNGPPNMMNSGPPQMMNNPMNSQPRPHMQLPPPPQPQGMSVEKQQILIGQVQRQQQQIQKLQQQVQQLLVQQQQQRAMEEQREQESPVFVTPPGNNIKLRHSEAYLRYIEGLRDNKASLSNWSEAADGPHPKLTNPLPTEWLGEGHGFDSAVDALWALRDHMLRDAVSISKIL